MIAVITCIELKLPLKILTFLINTFKTKGELKRTNYLRFKTTGFWTKHYTMSLWNTEDDMKRFARNGAHLQAMKKSALIAKEVRALVMNADKLPPWNEAKSLLRQHGKVLIF